MTTIRRRDNASTREETHSSTASVSGYQVQVVSPREAFDGVTESDDSLLVDIRTNAEWCLVGTPDVENAMFLEWRDLTGELIPSFIEELRYWAWSDVSIYVLSRAGGARAAEAAEAARKAGFSRVFVVDGGFEGPLDSTGHRGERGWKADGLPWRQW
ncbi:MAG: rhodanese-like domain-containing protein [Acidimicrobiia bacterium]|nr:rhodanese-like domain-containing protein [Acidimicrobiia bacterium]